MTYFIHKAPGWHNEPEDPVIETTEDETYAAMRAGRRIDIHIPGGSNRYDAYAVDGDGGPVKPIESFCCEHCSELHAWGEYGPVGTSEGKTLECPEAMDRHLVEWICEGCEAELNEED